MKKNTKNSTDPHCTVLEQRHLVSKMTQCDDPLESYNNRYKCYLKATQKSRKSRTCLRS